MCAALLCLMCCLHACMCIGRLCGAAVHRTSCRYIDISHHFGTFSPLLSSYYSPSFSPLAADVCCSPVLDVLFACMYVYRTIVWSGCSSHIMPLHRYITPLRSDVRTAVLVLFALLFPSCC